MKTNKELFEQWMQLDKYNWEKDSDYVAKYCPDKLDPDKYNWEKFSHFVAKYCPWLSHLRPNNIKLGVNNET